ncbi:MAG: hypothetical protein PHO03_03080 [Candidatus Omnitrophica bacterium]|nr:hypothetical protein [Candidatus Omnitrophota bacterium]
MQEPVKRAIKVNIILVAVAALAFAAMRKFSFSAGLLVGAGWSTANFLFTISLLEIALLRKPKGKLLLLLLIKFPVLYLLGFLILFFKVFPALSLLLGLSSILLVLGVFTIWPKLNKCNTNCPT